MFPILNPPPSSLPIPSLWVVPVHQPQASSIVHRTWTGNSFHTWYFTCFNAILPNLPTLSLAHRVHKTVLYISVSFAVSYTGPLFDWVIYFSGIELQELLVYFWDSLSVASFAIIFSHSEGCLFILLIVSFVVQKLLILIRSHLFIFAFSSFTPVSGS